MRGLTTPLIMQMTADEQARRSRASQKESGDDAAKEDSGKEKLRKKGKKVKKPSKVKKARKVQKMDLGAIFDAHIRHDFLDHDVPATMKTMAAEPYVHNVPTLTGGDGH